MGILACDESCESRKAVCGKRHVCGVADLCLTCQVAVSALLGDAWAGNAQIDVVTLGLRCLNLSGFGLKLLLFLHAFKDTRRGSICMQGSCWLALGLRDAA